MKTTMSNFTACGEKRRRAAALHDASRNTRTLTNAPASWSAPALWRFGLTLLLLVCTGNLFASDVATEFSAANKLYAEGKFAEAATAYETILQAGAQSPALLFNAGNAEFKAGHLGKAVAAYRRAELLAPRDAELRANLACLQDCVSEDPVFKRDARKLAAVRGCACAPAVRSGAKRSHR